MAEKLLNRKTLLIRISYLLGVFSRPIFQFFATYEALSTNIEAENFIYIIF